MPKADTTLDEVKELLRGCANQFRSYEKSHRAKGTDDGNLKAETNGTIANTLEEFLRRNP